MSLLLPFVAIALILFAAWALTRARRANPREGAEAYYLRLSLFTPAEQAFLGVLESQLPPGVRLFGKVRLEDIFAVKDDMKAGARQAARHRVGRGHVDFLLVSAGDLAPLAGIELDDRSPAEADRRERDRFVDELFTGVGLPLWRVPAQRSYNGAELFARLTDLLRSRLAE